MTAKRRVKKSGSKKAKRKVTGATVEKFISKKIKVTLTSLVFFLIIFAGSWIGYQYFFLGDTFIGDVFFILTYLSGFLSLAFFIALLVFIILRTFGR